MNYMPIIIVKHTSKCKDRDFLGCVLCRVFAPSKEFFQRFAHPLASSRNGVKLGWSQRERPKGAKLGTGSVFFFWRGKNSRVDTLKWMGFGIWMQRYVYRYVNVNNIPIDMYTGIEVCRVNENAQQQWFNVWGLYGYLEIWASLKNMEAIEVYNSYTPED